MKKVMVVMIGWMSLFISGFAEAEVIKPGAFYSSGDQFEFAGSGASFTVPEGWLGIYNSDHKRFRLTKMGSGRIFMTYQGKSYADAIADAKKPFIASDNFVMTPMLDKIEKYSAKTLRQVIPYAGKYRSIFGSGGGVESSAVMVVLKMPTGEAITIFSSGGGSNDFKALTKRIDLITQSLTFTRIGAATL